MKLQARDDIPVAQQSPEGPRAAPTRFTYNSGARPLSGFTIKRGIGRGGFGEVYFATSDAGKEVAIKLIRRNLEVELRGVTQCLNLKHPNLIDLYDIRSNDNGDEWVVMEYVSGDSLDDVIDRHPQGLPVEEALWWIRGICRGVAYLHDHGIVHRDLKPGNIFSDEGVVKVGDYGLAKFISCSRRSGQTESVGTVHYMAPEIANGRYGKEIDTYALGIILYEVLTGRVPFEGESVGEVLMKHLTAEPDLSRLSEPFRSIVQRALAKDPEVRLKNVNEMMTLLPAAEAVIIEAGEEPAFHPQAAPSHPAQQASFRPVQSIGNLHPAQSQWYEQEEPIYRAIRDTWNYCEHAWHNAQLHPLVRGLMLFALVAGLITTATVWLPTLFFAFFCYGIYYAIRGLCVQAARSNRPAAPASREQAQQVVDRPKRPEHMAATADYVSANPPHPIHPQRQRRLRQSWQQKAKQELAALPLRDKLTNLLGSMLMSALIALLASLCIPLLVDPHGRTEAMALQIWFMVIGTLGSWAILIPTRFSEGRIEDQVPMRGMQLVLGAVLGVAAWGLADMLVLEQPYWRDFSAAPHDAWMHSAFEWQRQYEGGSYSQPKLRDFVGYFALLFVLLRWWRQAECTRHRRLSLWVVAATLFWAYCLHVVWWFPQPTGVLLAGVISIATQLASPWILPSKRQQLTKELRTA